jgi:transcriptional regulator with XRE-family HTH domain
VIILAVDYVLIGKRLKKAREDKGITQEKLAEYLDVSNAYVSKIERGKTSLNLNTFSAICDYLGISMSFILTGSVLSSENYMRNEIAELINKCSPAKVVLIAKIIKEICDFKE